MQCESSVLPSVVSLSSMPIIGLPSVGSSPLSSSSVGVPLVAVGVRSIVGSDVAQHGAVADVDAVQGYMSSVWRDQETACHCTVFWEI